MMSEIDNFKFSEKLLSIKFTILLKCRKKISRVQNLTLEKLSSKS